MQADSIFKCIKHVSAASWAWLISLHIRSMWETICDAQAHSCTHSSNSKFLSKFSRKPLSGISDQKPPPFRKLQIWDDQSLLRNTPPPNFGKLQIWDDQSLLRNTPPPILENFRFEMTKVYSEIPPPIFGKLQIWDDQSLLRNTPPILENFRFEMTKVYSEIPPPPFRKIREIVCRD